MNDFHYTHLDRIIDEYENDSVNIPLDKFIMINYSKFYLMTIMSTFEVRMKACFSDFLRYPLHSTSTYPDLVKCIADCTKRNFIVEDSLYSRFHTMDRKTGIINLNASEFYKLFGGKNFETDIKTVFNSELINRISCYQNVVDRLSILIGINDKYDNDFVKNDDILLKLKRCTFVSAEQAFLTLKLKRNKVAHDYLTGISDSFEDIRDLYIIAVVYVIALEKSILALTNFPV